MSKFVVGDNVKIFNGGSWADGYTGTVIPNPYAEDNLVDCDGDYLVSLDEDLVLKVRSINGRYLELTETVPVLKPKPGDKVRFLVEGTILREDVHPNNWIINAPLFWGAGETRHIPKTSVVEVTESLTFVVGQNVPAEDVHLLALGTVLSEPWSGQLVVVGDDSLIYMDSSAMPFSNIDSDPSDEYYVVVSLPRGRNV